MRRLVLVRHVRALVGIALCFASFGGPFADDASTAEFEVPAWLFPINPPASPAATPPPPPDGARLLRVPNSTAEFTRAEVTNLFSARDWHPAEHPPMPAGSIERGRKLATTGAGRTLACAGCHGPGLRGSGEIPPIAGRSPTYLLRQLVAFRTGARDTPAAAPMKPVVAQLAVDEMIALAAYVGSIPP